MAPISPCESALIAAIAVATFVAVALDCGMVNAASVTSEDWATRPETVNRVLLMKPDQPSGAVILLPGSSGNINLDTKGNLGWGEDDFLIRTRTYYTNSGLIAIVPDVAVDQKPPASLAGFRTSQMQADDLYALADHLLSMAPKVWMVAYDTGATSALNAVARGRAGLIDGLVLISPVLQYPDLTSTLLIDGAKLAVSRMPVLVIGHQFDRCSLPVVDRIKNAAAVLRASKFQAIVINNRSEKYSISDPFEYPKNDCNRQANHALAGSDATVSDQIINWIIQQKAAAK
jgi:pimeloyl-ACP methyl ester carboxylesterase